MKFQQFLFLILGILGCSLFSFQLSQAAERRVIQRPRTFGAPCDASLQDQCARVISENLQRYDVSVLVSEQSIEVGSKKRETLPRPDAIMLLPLPVQEAVVEQDFKKRWRTLQSEGVVSVPLPYDNVQEQVPTDVPNRFFVRSGETVRRIEVQNGAVVELDTFACPGAEAMSFLNNGDLAVFTRGAGRAEIRYWKNQRKGFHKTTELEAWPAGRITDYFGEIRPGVLQVSTNYHDMHDTKIMFVNYYNNLVGSVKPCGSPQEIFPLNDSWVCIIQGGSDFTTYNVDTGERTHKDTGFDEDVLRWPSLRDASGRTVIAQNRAAGSGLWRPPHRFFTVDEQGHELDTVPDRFHKITGCGGFHCRYMRYEKGCVFAQRSLDRRHTAEERLGSVLIDDLHKLHGPVACRAAKICKAEDDSYVLSWLDTDQNRLICQQMRPTLPVDATERPEEVSQLLKAKVLMAKKRHGMVPSPDHAAASWEYWRTNTNPGLESFRQEVARELAPESTARAVVRLVSGMARARLWPKP